MGHCCSAQADTVDEADTDPNTTKAKEENGNDNDNIKNVDDNKTEDTKKFKQPGVCDLQRTLNLNEDLKLLQQKYPQYKPLISRTWINILPQDMSQPQNEQNTMTIMQFNMLADGLTGAYTITETDKTFLNVDKACLELTYRGLRLVEELVRYSPDIICLEECDTLDFFMEYLGPLGYLSEFQEKTNSPVQDVIQEIAEERNGERLNMRNDGVAIIYKKDKFEIIGTIERIDMKQNKEKVFALAVPFRCTQSPSKAEFLMVCTHLKSTKQKEGEELRERQIKLLFSELIKNEKTSTDNIGC